ncbi:sugar isomerase [Spirochaetia bacterium]|nr:sugar isomerase [Spirochaetia bacterium]
MKIDDSAIENIRLNSGELFVAERKVAEYISSHLDESVHMNVAELARTCAVSEATIVRMCKHLGYKGFYQLKLMLAKNIGQDKVIGSNNAEITTVGEFFQGISNNMYQIGQTIDNENLQKCVKLIEESNTVHIIASGNTIPSALDFAFRLGRIEIATTSSFSDELEQSSINLARYGDIVIGISHTGGSLSVIKAFNIARSRGITTIAITDIPDCPLNKIADHVLSTGVGNSNVYVFGAESHINTSAVMDALLFFLVKQKRIKMGLEMFLPETKMDNDYQ